MDKNDILKLIGETVMEQYKNLLLTVPEIAEDMTYQDFCLEVFVAMD